MKNHVTIWFLLWMQQLFEKGATVCTKSSCPVGYDCDTNTGFCRQFRQPVNTPAVSSCPLCLPGYQCNQRTGRCEAAYYQSSPCDGVTCPAGFECDQNTGICRQFRSPNSVPSIQSCANVVCMTGYECDPASKSCVPSPKSPAFFTDPCKGVHCPLGARCDSGTGQCVVSKVAHSVPIIAEDKCASINCPQGYFCDSNTGLCRPARRPASDSKCSGVICPAGQQCDTNTGICRAFRAPNALPAVAVPRDSDKCRGIMCAAGYYCDGNTGRCRPSRIPGRASLPEGDMSPCANVRCPEGLACDSNTGLCRSFRTSQELTIPLPIPISQPAPFRQEPQKCGVCAEGTRCDENTGICRPFRTPMRFAKLLQRYAELCQNVTCETGFSCISGSCEPAQGKASCEGTVCDDDEFCDSESGKCEKFRSKEQLATDPTTTEQAKNVTKVIIIHSTTPIIQKVEEKVKMNPIKDRKTEVVKAVDDACSKVRCGYGMICDSTSGKCLTLRAVIESELIALKRPESVSDPCKNVVCFEGLQCDKGSGDCVAVRQIEPVNLCLMNRIKCPLGFECESSKGTCLPIGDDEKSVTTYPSSYTIGRDPCMALVCPANTRCDSATGRCVVNAIMPPSTPITPASSNKSLGKDSKHTPVDLCWNVYCSDGTSCDPNSGACRPPRIVQKDDHLTKCIGINCPAGQKCDPNSGHCIVFRYVDLCEGIRCDNDHFCRQGNCVFRDIGCGPEPCPNGSKCDGATGTCTVSRNEKQKMISKTKEDLCKNVTCYGTTGCDPATGTCKEVSCPLHSHFVQCGSPCPFTCNQLDKCKDPCVPTCQCDDGYVQIRRTDVQCVLAAVCRRTIDPCEEANDCESEDICVDGMCQPKSCPGIRKSPMRPGCNYVLQRGNDNCLQLNTVC